VTVAPEFEEEVVVVAFRRTDLMRLHTLLACYESPFRTEGEAAERAGDTRAHDTLRRYLAELLECRVADGKL
jgi:hypothetical protein